jgi:Pyruvate/2-oxoacid:ferredoxin oxidoreductase delta subunit
VTVVALESAKQLPAQQEEIDEALEEGIVLLTGGMLRSARALADGVRLELVRVTFEPGAQRGQFTVTPLPDSDFALLADAIVVSIGQDPDLSPFAALASDGNLLRVDARQATSAECVYAGGDLASQARFVTEAVGMGKRAAWQIDRALRGETAPAEGAETIVPLASIATAYYPRQPRAAAARLAPVERLAGNAEVQLGLDLDTALRESERCFSCGTCVLCDNCVNVCPDLAVRRDGAGYVVLGDYCKGCGLCVKECPTGSMKMVEEAR